MRFYIGLIMGFVIFSFIAYQLAYGGGKPEHGREGNGPFGGLPLW